jgi:excisionase family DNA binding protein
MHQTAYTPTPPRDEPELLDSRAVAAMLTVSVRHVERLAEAGRMPAGLKIGRLRRWRRRVILDWIERGAPVCRRPAGGNR